MPPDQVKIAVQAAADGTATVEATYTPIVGLEPQEGRRVALRMDAIAAGTEVSEVFFPRALASVYLQMDSSRDIPLGVSWRPAILNRDVSRNDRLKMNFGVTRHEGSWVAQRIEIRAEGTAKDPLRILTEPAPAFDKKNRMDLAYESVISQQAPLGWKVVRATFTDAALHKFAVEHLGHRHMFANITQEVEIIHVFEPVVVIDKRECLAIENCRILARYSFFVSCNLFNSHQVTLLFLAIRIANHSSCATDQQNCLVAMIDKVTNHHSCR